MITGTNINIDLLGTFISGPYLNKLVTTTVIYPTSNFNQCNTNMGMELLTGLIVVVVVGGPTCTGIAVKKFCPGIHYSEEELTGISLPGMPPIDIPIIIPGIPIIG